MNPSDERFARTIGEHLDRAVEDLRPGLAYRLQQARAAALARLSAEAVTDAGGAFARTPALAGAGGANLGGVSVGRPIYARARTWIGILALVGATFGWQQWQAWQELEDLEDLDAQILTSDLPIDAYVDRGFQQWLRTSAPAE